MALNRLTTGSKAKESGLSNILSFNPVPYALSFACQINKIQ